MLLRRYDAMNEDSQLEFNDKIQTSQGKVDPKDVLIGGEKLVELMIFYDVGVQTKTEYKIK